MMCRWPPRRWHTGSTRQATRQPESAQAHGPHGESGHPLIAVLGSRVSDGSKPQPTLPYV